MGKEQKHSKKHKKRRRRDDENDAEVAEHPDAAGAEAKLFSYAASGRARKLRRLLADQPELVQQTRAADAATPLHQACRFGHADTVGLLLRRHADAGAVDAAGNTPGHLAAMHRHWLVLRELVQHADTQPDLDLPNNAGLTIRQITQLSNSQGPAATADAGGGAHLTDSGDDSGRSGGGGSRAAAGAEAGAAAVDEDAAWRARLADELSDDDGPWAGLSGIKWGEPADPAAAAAAAGGEPSPPGAASNQGKGAGRAGRNGNNDEDDDDADNAWADRLWKDMQDHRQHLRAAAAAAAAAAGASGSKGSGRSGLLDRDAAAQERQRRAAAAAAESARILKEEQAKDADWRAAMMRQIEQAALPLQRDTYESRWAALEKRPPGKAITFGDVPWPVSSGAGRQQQQRQQQGGLVLDAQQLRSLVLSGARGPQDVKLALRRELMRWHPDKFVAKWGSRLAEADRAAILEGVHAVAQHLTALKQ